MSIEGSLTNIPNFLSAGSPMGLQRLMRMNNLKKSIIFKYDIVWVDSEKKWYAWYYYDVDKEILAKGVKRGTIS